MSTVFNHYETTDSLFSKSIDANKLYMPSDELQRIYNTKIKSKKIKARSKQPNVSTSRLQDSDEHDFDNNAFDFIQCRMKNVCVSDPTTLDNRATDQRTNDLNELEVRVQRIYQRIESWAISMLTFSSQLDFRLLDVFMMADCQERNDTYIITNDNAAISERLFTQILPRVKSKSPLLRLICYAYDPYTRPNSFSRLYSLMTACESYYATDMLQSEITSTIAPYIRLMTDALVLDSHGPLSPEHQMTLDLIHDLQEMLKAQYNWEPIDETFSGPFNVVRFSNELFLASELFLPKEVHLSIWKHIQDPMVITYFDPHTWPLPEVVLHGASEQSIMRRIIQKAFTTPECGTETDAIIWSGSEEEEVRSEEESEASDYIFDSATEVSGCADITDSDWSIVNE
ncbi:hypothetical protein BGW37DRAFT_485954 [Umbelopsis sp. PMI_123]|nr:hypothetical protein BGW37DRAFT_485954 [Umbelopsis sp. PMI_123]